MKRTSCRIKVQVFCECHHHVQFPTSNSMLLYRLPQWGQSLFEVFLKSFWGLFEVFLRSYWSLFKVFIPELRSKFFVNVTATFSFHPTQSSSTVFHNGSLFEIFLRSPQPCSVSIQLNVAPPYSTMGQSLFGVLLRLFEGFLRSFWDLFEISSTMFSFHPTQYSSTVLHNGTKVFLEAFLRSFRGLLEVF